MARLNNDGIDAGSDEYRAFLDMPYALLPKSRGEFWLIVPRFVPFAMGHLERQTPSYNYFIVNKYVDWITPLPPSIREQVGIRPLFSQALVDGGNLKVSPDEAAKAWGRYRDFLVRSTKDGIFEIRKGMEFELIASIIDDGNLPFMPNPVMEDDLRSPPRKIELRRYQHDAWERFCQTGMVGVYWPPSAGKTYFSLYAGERINGNKLVVVPSVTLKEQWEQKIRELCRFPSEWQVHTYQYLTGKNKWIFEVGNFALTVFDEAHHLPATTFSRLATIRTRYRIGLSASPYREDGRTEYIFALTGYPVGMRWQDLSGSGAIEEPDVTVMLCSDLVEKRKVLERVLASCSGRTIIFCDSLRRGSQLSEQLGIPFVHGETANRLDVLDENPVAIVSRVGDEGLSLPGLETVIEYDFFGGSRRQELQRVGRVMHGRSCGRHVIIMTDGEHEKYGHRLLSLHEQGITVRYVR
jgi:DNA excision repair protein ERCC-3